jgi:2-polyprenyl-3-methyl-5-hydroxy-6-metoxy-1,4-benzoquinol methylase
MAQQHPSQQQVEGYLQQSAVHQDWEEVYLNADTHRFYDLVFRWLKPWLQGGMILDAGCGTGVLTQRLALHGPVTAVDLSLKAVEATQQRVATAHLLHVATVQQADLTALPFREGQFPVVFCWGVLMHVPAVEQALSELMRVTAPGGILIIGENHQGSLQSRLTRMLGRGTHAEVRQTPAGREHWYAYAEGKLVARHADVRWLAAQATARGFTRVARHAGQFSELYASVRSPWLRRRFHALNRFWFRLGWAAPALGNVLIFRRQA